MRLEAVLGGDLVLLGMREVPVADDRLPADVKAVDPVRGGKDEPGDRVVLSDMSAWDSYDRVKLK